MSLKRKRQPTYIEETLRQAMEDIKAGATLNVTSRKYKIPRTTLHARVNNKHGSRLGTKPALDDKDEADLAAWIEHMCSIGCSVSRNQIGDSVVLSLKVSNKTNPFVNKRPGKNWFDGFIRRHKLCEKIRETRRQLLKGIGINGTYKWFENLNTQLKRENLHGLSRTRTYNIGEISLPLHLKSNSTWCVKEGPTVLIAANAAGQVLPPMIVFDSNDDSNMCDAKLRRGWSVEANDNANMSAELLYNYVKNYFYSWLTNNGIQLPIVLFLYQELASYLTKVLCDFCDEHNILLAILPPSPHRATTAIEMTLFPILRREFIRNLRIFVKKRRIFNIGKNDFVARLEEALDCINVVDNLEKGFYECGLYPLSNERYIKACIKLKPEDNIENIVQNEKKSEESVVDQSSVLKYIENNLDLATIKSFRSAVDDPIWTGKIQDTNLFYLWRNIIKNVIFGRIDESNDGSSDIDLLSSDTSENQENEMLSQYTSDLKSCVLDRHESLSFIDNNLNCKRLHKSVSIIVVHPDVSLQDSGLDED